MGELLSQTRASTSTPARSRPNDCRAPRPVQRCRFPQQVPVAVDAEHGRGRRGVRRPRRGGIGDAGQAPQTLELSPQPEADLRSAAVAGGLGPEALPIGGAADAHTPGHGLSARPHVDHFQRLEFGEVPAAGGVLRFGAGSGIGRGGAGRRSRGIVGRAAGGRPRGRLGIRSARGRGAAGSRFRPGGIVCPFGDLAGSHRIAIRPRVRHANHRAAPQPDHCDGNQRRTPAGWPRRWRPTRWTRDQARAGKCSWLTSSQRFPRSANPSLDRT